ncbi:MAG: ABC transporter permease [Oscillibacter sp.]|nr:ABC transporter permease [Oscillibacter sp.]
MKKKSSAKELLQKLGTLMALFILVIIFCITMPDKFPKINNIMNILKQASINCLIASGMLCALITAGIDLSVGSNCVLCTCFIGVLVERFGLTNPVVLAIAGLAISTLCGTFNGLLLTRLDLPHPFVSTMGMKNVLLGTALVITGSKSIGFTGKGVDSLMWIGGASLFQTRDAAGKVAFPGIPVSFILVLVVYVIFDIFLKKSALGRQIYCCGGNPEAARLSGIPAKNVLTFVYALSGFMAGMAGVVSVGRLASANANSGATYDNDAIAACIVGGASFTGGKGTIWGTLIGAMIMAVIRNGLNLMGASNDVQYIVIGGVIILAVTIDVVRNKMEAKARKMAAV